MKRYLIIILLSILLMIGQLGCAHVPSYKPPSLSEQIKAKLGTIGVVSARFKPDATFKEPLKKKDAVKEGAEEGARSVYDASMIAPLGGIILLPIYISVGGLIGYMGGVSDSQKEEAGAALKRAIAELEIQETMRKYILNIAQEKTTHHFSIIEELGPTFFDEKVNYNSLGGSNVNTVFEISVKNWGLNGEGRINPPLSLFMDVNIRIISIEDGEVLYSTIFKYEGMEKSKFTKWAANNGQLFREEFNRVCQSLAEKIVREIFLTPES